MIAPPKEAQWREVPPFENGLAVNGGVAARSAVFIKWFGSAAFSKWIVWSPLKIIRLPFKNASLKMTTTFYKLYCRLLIIGLPPIQNGLAIFEDGSNNFWKLYMAAFWKWFGSAAFSKWITWSAFENDSTAFWKCFVEMSTAFYKLYCRIFENRSAAFSKWSLDNGSTDFSKWFGHLLKIGQPWPPFENYMAAFSRWVDRFFKMVWSAFKNGSTVFWKWFLENVDHRRRLSGIKRQFLKIFVPPNTA